MTASYDITTNVGKVRLKTGDNILASAVFTDEEIGVFLTDQSSNVNRASADLLEAWANTYAVNADSEKIGDYAYTQSIVAKMLATAERLRKVDAETPYQVWAELDLTSGSAITTEDD